MTQSNQETNPYNPRTSIIYEQPLNERIRAFLRLDSLFVQIDAMLRDPNLCFSRSIISLLIEIINISNRTDLKTEIIKEMERLTLSLSKLQDKPKVNSLLLNRLLEELCQRVDQLKDIEKQIGHNIRQHDLLKSIMQRSGIPGGTNEIDLPQFHYWLQQPQSVRIDDIYQWINSFKMLKTSIQLTLKLLRDSSLPEQIVAIDGVFKKSLDANIAYQMIRVSLPQNVPYYAEISGGKHRISMRFLQPSPEGHKSTQINDNVEFQLACCAI